MFEAYARHYDALYRDKDYAGECDFVERAWRAFGERPRRVLDLAGGAGGHGLLLAERGYRVTAVDRSAAMLARYRRKAAARGIAVELHCEALEDLSVAGPFDAALCMFDALGYLETNARLGAALRRLRARLRPGGVFVFDGWHSPAVRAEHRIREFTTPEGRAWRLSRTAVDWGAQVASVEFRVLAPEGDGLREEAPETHRLRFFGAQELTLLLESTGWRVRGLCEAYSLEAPVTGETRRLAVVATPAE